MVLLRTAADEDDRLVRQEQSTKSLQKAGGGRQRARQVPAISPGKTLNNFYLELPGGAGSIKTLEQRQGPHGKGPALGGRNLRDHAVDRRAGRDLQVEVN